MATKTPPAEFFADLEGEATPFASAPRYLSRDRPGYGDQAAAIAGIRQAVVQALVRAGYELGLAERIAAETANLVPEIERKLQT